LLEILYCILYKYLEITSYLYFILAVCQQKKWIMLSIAQKHDICQAKEINLNIKNIDLANKYLVGKLTITDILNKKECWLAITEEEEALGLWVDNVLNSNQDIDVHILKTKFKKEDELASVPSMKQIENN
ncbi:5367_t:CDS:2, partial [Cetraspora pellucida]